MRNGAVSASNRGVKSDRRSGGDRDGCAVCSEIERSVDGDANRCDITRRTSKP